jgi:uncharacterized membrane protein
MNLLPKIPEILADSPHLQLMKASVGRGFSHFLLSMHLGNLLRECQVALCLTRLLLKPLLQVSLGDTRFSIRDRNVAR